MCLCHVSFALRIVGRWHVPRIIYQHESLLDASLPLVKLPNVLWSVTMRHRRNNGLEELLVSKTPKSTQINHFYNILTSLWLMDVVWTFKLGSVFFQYSKTWPWRIFLPVQHFHYSYYCPNSETISMLQRRELIFKWGKLFRTPEKLNTAPEIVFLNGNLILMVN